MWWSDTGRNEYVICTTGGFLVRRLSQLDNIYAALDKAPLKNKARYVHSCLPMPTIQRNCCDGSCIQSQKIESFLELSRRRYCTGLDGLGVTTRGESLSPDYSIVNNNDSSVMHGGMICTCLKTKLADWASKSYLYDWNSGTLGSSPWPARPGSSYHRHLQGRMRGIQSFILLLAYRRGRSEGLFVAIDPNWISPKLAGR